MTIVKQEFDARDVRLIAGENTAAISRKQIVWDVDLPTPHYKEDKITIVPLFCANVHFAGPSMAKKISTMSFSNTLDPASRVQMCLHKEVPEDKIAKTLIEYGTQSLWCTVGVNPDNAERELQKLKNIREIVEGESDHRLNKVCIDASNGHAQITVDQVKAVRDIFQDNAVILAGNVVTEKMTNTLLVAGADGVKLNHGPAKVCRTKHNAGTHRPTLTTAIECSNAAHKLGGFTVSDGGGISQSGTSAVLMAGGADAVMSGSMFAGYHECNEPVLDDGDGRKYMIYFGSASIRAHDRFNGEKPEHRPSEGTDRKIYMKSESLESTITQWLGGISSAMSFQSDCEPEGQRTINSGDEPSDYWRFSQLSHALDKGTPRFTFSPRS